MVSENQWLSYCGFQHFPFERPEAGNEGSDFLASCFVEPENFPAILGKADSPTTALLFATRGTGKTACRVMVDYFCRTGNVPIDGGQEIAHVLSIPHTHLHLVATKANLFTSAKEAQTDRLVDYHVREILRRAMPALSDLLAATPQIYDIVTNLTSALKQDLSWFVPSYATYLSSPQRGFLLDLLGEPLPLDAFQEASPLDHLAQLVNMMHMINIPATYVLIDGVDEYMETAANPEKAYEVIRPLLGTLQLMDKTPHLALKFFLPDSIKPLLLADPAIRLDRGFTLQTIRWRDADLVKILRRRLDAVKLDAHKGRDRIITGFDTLCIPELRSQIEQELAREAKGNPRHLIILAGLMVRAHFNRKIIDQEDIHQLNRKDWHIALEEYKSRIIRRHHTVEQVNPKLLLLIEQGENERVEFKSSLRWDFHQKKVNRKLEHTIAKTIAAFLNGTGGALLIGIADDGQILGLENDLNCVQNNNTDGFRQKLIHTIETYLRIEAIHYISITVESIKDKQIAVIKVKQSSKPIYVKVNSQSEFWIRVDTVTRQLDAETANNYIKIHWEK